MPDVIDWYPDPKRVSERSRRAVDYSMILEAGDTVATGSATAKRRDTGADATSDLIDGTPVVDGTKVVVQLKAGGLAGKDYEVRIVATTTQGDILPVVALLRVRGE